MRKTVILFAAAIGLILTGCMEKSVSPKSDDEKVIYAIGVDMGSKLEGLNLSKKEFQVLKTGLNDGVNNKKPKVDMKVEANPTKVRALIQARSKQVAEKEKAEAAKFVAKELGEKGSTKTESGLIYREITAGTGANPKATDTVKVHYHGTLRDGKVFDSSKDKGTPATLPLNRVIPCWTEGIQKMKVGGKSILVCPSEIAYKDRGAPPVIKPGAALKFEVELFEIVKADAKPDAKPEAKPAPKKGK